MPASGLPRALPKADVAVVVLPAGAPKEKPPAAGAGVAAGAPNAGVGAAAPPNEKGELRV